MTCGPANTGQHTGSTHHGADAFSFGQDILGTHMSAMALVWTAPWRAASVVMSEALRETSERLR
ncbi:MAG: hypothetical protein ACFBRM_11770 [Pikeienuella sp.]